MPFVGPKNEMNRPLGHLCALIGWTGPGEPPEDGEMIEMTLSSRLEILALAVWGPARYLSVTKTPHNTYFHTWIWQLPDSQSRCSRGRRPSLAESVLSSTYWGREDDLGIEFSLIFQPNANLILAHCLRHWLNINPTLPYVTSRIWLDVVGAVCDTSCEILGHQTCAA